MTQARHPQAACAGDLAWQGVSARRDLRRLGHQLRGVQRGRREGRAVPVRRRRRRDPGDAARGRRVRLARRSSPASSRASATATGCTARTIRPRASGATRTSCCSTRTRRPSTARSTGTSRCSATTSAIRTAATTTTRRPACPSPWSSTRSSTGASTARRGHEYADTVIYEAHVKGLTKTHPDIPEQHPRHLRRHRAPGDHRAPEVARRQRRSN